MDLKSVLVKIGVPFKNDKIVIPEWVTSLKFDIGVCYTATHTQNWLDNDPGAFVFGFEPNPLSLKYMHSKPEDREMNFRGYMHGETGRYRQIDATNIGKRCFFVPIALSNVDAPTTMDFYCTANMPDCSSLLKPKETFTDVDSVVKVPVYNLSDFFNLLPDDVVVDFIKVDVQGVDLKVLKGAGKYLSERVVFVTAEPETQQYEGCIDNSAENITKYMESMGFVRVRHSNTHDPTFLNKKFWDRQNVFISQFL